MVSRRLPVEKAVSAGGVVWRKNEEGGLEVVLCGRRVEGLWGLPKGTPNSDEELVATAVREVQEETGLRVKVGEQLGTITYWFTAKGTRFHKQVHHWLMEPTGGDVAHHDHEYDIVEWVPIENAVRRATYENERQMLVEARRRLENGQ